MEKASSWRAIDGLPGGGLHVSPSAGNHNAVKDVQGRCWTYVFWGLGAAPFFRETSLKLAKHVSFDVRRFPGTFKRIGPEGLMVLRRSPFLFARKFFDNTTELIGQAEQILLGDT